MIITAQIHYDDSVTMSGEALAKAVAEQLSELIDDGQMPCWGQARRVVAWSGEPITDTADIPSSPHPRAGYVGDDDRGAHR
jgi:hypothetical protein